MNGFKENIKRKQIGQPCQTHSDQRKTFQKQKKKQEGAACHLRMLQHTQKNLRQTLPTLSRWTGEGRRLLQVLFLDYHQTKTLINNADNFFLSKSWAKGWEQNREKDMYKFALVTHTTRAPSTCASKLQYPQNGRVGAWAIHGIWRINSILLECIAPLSIRDFST